MCGILVNFSKRVNLSQRSIKSAFTRLNHRGPDDFGIKSFSFNDNELVLLHTRLSILDLSSLGHQPITSTDGRHHLIYNGEIVNYLEIKAELIKLGCTFATKTDTEVLLKAWQAWGINSLLKFEGMFAFVIYDTLEQKLYVVRDAFGIKPLFYRQLVGGGFQASSEIAPLYAFTDEIPETNWQRAYQYLAYSIYDSDEQTFYKDVWQLKPAHYLIYDLNTLTISQPKRWWKPNLKQNNTLSFIDASNQVRETFLDSVKKHLRSDVPLGIALSGGIDSAAIACAVRHIEPDMSINTYSYIADDEKLNEEPWVDKINDHINANSNKIRVGVDEMADDLLGLIKHQGEPFSTTSIYAQYAVFKQAKSDGITVTLDGQGADELLGGYIGYPGYRLRSLFDNGAYKRFFKFLCNWPNVNSKKKSDAIKLFLSTFLSDKKYHQFRHMIMPSKIDSFFNQKLLSTLNVDTKFEDKSIKDLMNSRWMIAEMVRSIQGRGLPGLLRHADRNAMCFSIESRVPFLTREFCELMYQLPEPYLVSDKGVTKHVFRQAMRGIVPDAILDRKDKIGFETNERTLLHQLKHFIYPYLENFNQLHMFNANKVKLMFDDFYSKDKGNTQDIWRFANFAIWYQTCIKDIS